MPYELQQIAQVFIDSQRDWLLTENKVIEKNLLQKGSKATLKRKFNEFKKRCSSLTDEELEALSKNENTKLLVFLASVKTYPLLFEFCTEVLRNKYLIFDTILLESDWINFIEAKKSVSKALNAKSESTLKKTKQVIFNMLRGVGLIDGHETSHITKIYLPDNFVKIVCRDNPKWLAAFLYSDADIAASCKESL